MRYMEKRRFIWRSGALHGEAVRYMEKRRFIWRSGALYGEAELQLFPVNSVDKAFL